MILILQSRNLETALTFRESCDLHLSALNVLSRIDNVSLSSSFYLCSALPSQTALQSRANAFFLLASFRRTAHSRGIASDGAANAHRHDTRGIGKAPIASHHSLLVSFSSWNTAVERFGAVCEDPECGLHARADYCRVCREFGFVM